MTDIPAATGELFGIVVDLSKWKMKDKRALTAAVMSAGQSGDEGEIYPHLAKVVKAWPWSDLSPANPKDYDELTAEGFQEVVNAVMEAVKRISSPH